MAIDISIDGQGFFTVNGTSKRGKRWLKRNVQGVEHDTVYCDDQNLTQNIAEGATEFGLRVSVNHFIYLAGGLRGEPVAA